MKYDFDTPINRYGTESLKYSPEERGRPADALPMWVADMDFRTAPAITNALIKRAEHGVYGYTESTAPYTDVLRKWFARRHNWDIEPQWLVKTFGVVNALHIAVRAFTEPGEGVLIQRPVYYPFSEAIERQGRKLINSPLRLVNGRYEIDFDDFDVKAADAKVFILCNPHNPVGRVWQRDELIRIADICGRRGVIVVSDELHQDFVYPGNTHMVFASLSREIAEFTVTCTAASKSFNTAGLTMSNILIANPDLRKRFKYEYNAMGLSQINLMGLEATRAAYSDCDDWLDAVREYILGNIHFADSYLNSNMPELKLITPEATYLLWVDFRAWKVSQKELELALIRDAKLWLDSGTIFGPEGAGFQRFNVACPRSTLISALERVKSIRGRYYTE
ncbi:MAG: pyridoxal phosphate-dependent aminotransferase [Oscillospiraceae bacterium]|jgi:cystathionine beta-lyase|nr:pyridoxal phosphate-dependent aminotransferase [Oscillospiraceae bacterium]